MNPDFWHAKRVLVTGHTGFKGSWLTLWLKKLGANVIGYALPPATQPSMFDLTGVAAGSQHVVGDIRSLGDLSHVFRRFEPQIVFHLAAQSLVRESYVDPVGTYETNVLGTVNVLEAVRHSKSARAVVIVTSDKCYENLEQDTAYRESDPMGGHDPYSSSKGAAELVTASYRRSYFSDKNGPAIASARAGNVIGGGDFCRDRLVPDIVRAAAADQPVSLRNASSIRPWQFVLEPLSGYLTLAERLCLAEGHEYAGGWNFGPTERDAITVDQLAKMVCSRLSATLGRNIAREYVAREDQRHEARLLHLDSTKATEALGWKPTLNLCKAIELTSDWYAAFLRCEDTRTVTLEQLKEYQSSAIVREPERIG